MLIALAIVTMVVQAVDMLENKSEFSLFTQKGKSSLISILEMSFHVTIRLF